MTGENKAIRTALPLAILALASPAWAQETVVPPLTPVDRYYRCATDEALRLVPSGEPGEVIAKVAAAGCEGLIADALTYVQAQTPPEPEPEPVASSARKKPTGPADTRNAARRAAEDREAARQAQLAGLRDAARTAALVAAVRAKAELNRRK